MRLFLRYINPLLALAVLLFCLLAASTDEGSKYTGFLGGPFQIYFLAKGIFCSVALLLLGKVVEFQMVALRQKSTATATSRTRPADRSEPQPTDADVPSEDLHCVK
jgi:hypothetical protein